MIQDQEGTNLGHSDASLPGPVDSAIQCENSITEFEGHDIIGQLLKEGINVNPKDSGTTLDYKRFKIAIPAPSDSKKLTIVKDRMSSLGFRQANSGAYGTLFFLRPLKKEVQHT